MQTGNRTKKLLSILLVLFVTCTIIILFITNSFTNYLSKSQKVNSNILLVEGWLPPYAIEMAYNEFIHNDYVQIITTGLKISDYYLIGMNGYLIFYPKDKTLQDNAISQHLIEVHAYSELGGENSAQFNVFINDSQIAGFTAGKRSRKFGISWMGRLTDIDSIMVQFVNDGVGSYGDKNLYVKEIIIDNKISIPYQNHSVYDILMPNGKYRIVNNFTSYAQLARNRLIVLGIDSSKIKAISGNRVKINRTLTSALAFRDWLQSSDINVKGINIVSIGTHARRTWMTYNRILKGNYEIGVISLPDYRELHSRKYKILKTFRETFALFYYWIILIPY